MKAAHFIYIAKDFMASLVSLNRHSSSLILILITVVIVSVGLYWLQVFDSEDEDIDDSAISQLLFKVTDRVDVIILPDSTTSSPQQSNCTYHSCFDVYKCEQNALNQVLIYVYPSYRFIDSDGSDLMPTLSRQYYEVLEAVIDSSYYTDDPSKACLFIPLLDTLSEEALNVYRLGQMLEFLPYWQNGSNHLLFNMLPGSAPTYHTKLTGHTAKAMIAGAGMSTYTYRPQFDVSLPLFDPFIHDTNLIQLADKPLSSKRHWFLASSQKFVRSVHHQTLTSLAADHTDFLYLTACTSQTHTDAPSQGEKTQRNKRCKVGGNLSFDYPHILQEARFCLVLSVNRLAQAVLLDSMKTGCIPVIVTDFIVLPFHDVLDWKRASVLIRDGDLGSVMNILHEISSDKISLMQRQVRFYYNTYFRSMYQITLATLQVINDRVYPYAAKSFASWNDPPEEMCLSNPLFYPHVAPMTSGFTAVILTYDRVQSLFEVIVQVSKAPNLAKVLVVWNNQVKPPPPASAWPKISKPLKVVQTQENKLSNRFYPYDEIETEAVLSLDDDIVMLTADEIEFAYSVWREFPDRLVGFPSRQHLFNVSEKKWKYESEWTNEISMVLTGAAFYHKYYSFLYTSAMPGNIKTWVDEHMNCEDIAFNFLIANVTGKAPVKVAARKKFKCPECQNVDISSDISHMIERSECINRFAQSYGTMPLKTVEFRADPVLYKDSNVPRRFKKFRDIGTL